MKVTKQYIKQLVVEALNANGREGGAMFEEEKAPKTYLELYKEMGQAILDGAGEEELAQIVQDMIALHPEQEPTIRRRAASQIGNVGALRKSGVKSLS